MRQKKRAFPLPSVTTLLSSSSQSPDIIAVTCSNCRAVGFTGYVREREPKPQTSSVCLFFYYSVLSVFFFCHFWALWIFGNINVELSLQSCLYQNSFIVGLHTQKHKAGLCFAEWQAEIIIRTNASVFPAGWKSWREVHISIKIMQSVALCFHSGRDTVRFPSINLALCCFIASSLLNSSIRKMHFHGSFRKWPVF